MEESTRRDTAIPLRRCADATDFEGLYFRECSPDERKLGLRSTPELHDLDRGFASLDALQAIFERLEHSGVRIPTAYYLTDCGESPKQSWLEIHDEISWAYSRLSAIVDAMLDEDRRDLDSICCS